MNSIESLLQDILQKYKENPVVSFKEKGTDYQKKWNAGVQYFQKEINKERVKFGFRTMPFIAVRSKLVALKEIDDLRFFYRKCKEYARTKDKYGNQNTFCKCYFGALKILK